MASPDDSRPATPVQAPYATSPNRAKLRPALIAVILIACLGLARFLSLRNGLPSDPDAVLQRAQDAYREGHLDRANALLDQLGSLRTPRPLDLLLRAQVALEADRLEESLDALHQINSDHPVAPVALLLQGQIEARRGRLPAAEAAFRDAVRLEPRYVQARRELTFIYSIQRRLPELDRQLAALAELGEMPPSYVLYWTRIRNGIWNVEKDLPRLREFVAADPDDRLSRLSLAEAFRRSGDPQRAALTVAPLPIDDPDAVAVRAWIAIDRGLFNEADRLLGSVPDDHPSLSPLRAELAMTRNDPEEAIPSLRIAEQHDPYDRRVQFLMGRALTMLNRAEEAEPHLQAVRLHDELNQLASKAAAMEAFDDPQLCVEMGRRCQGLGRLLEARAWFGAALAIDPFHDEAQQALARIEDDRTDLTGSSER